MNESTTPNRTGNPLITFLYCIPAILLLTAAAYLWYSHSQNKDQLEQLSVQNQQLQKELAAAKAKINDLNSGDSSAATKERLAEARSTKPAAPEEEVESLILQTPTVDQAADGLVVHFAFKPVEGAELPDDITMAVRVPKSSTSKILELKCVSALEGSNVRTVINPSGYIGLIHGSPADLGAMDFEIKVSEPVKTTVRGSRGIIDFELDVTPDGCTVRKL